MSIDDLPNSKALKFADPISKTILRECREIVISVDAGNVRRQHQPEMNDSGLRLKTILLNSFQRDHREMRLNGPIFCRPMECGD